MAQIETLTAERDALAAKDMNADQRAAAIAAKLGIREPNKAQRAEPPASKPTSLTDQCIAALTKNSFTNN